MATDATGAPTSLGIPKFNTSADAPSGLGGNAQMDSIDALLVARVVKPSGIVSGEVPVWNGTSWVRSSVTNVGAASLGSGTPDSTKFLRGDSSWQVPPNPAPTYQTTLPGSPVNGQETILVDSTSAPTYAWRFRFNSTSGKWDFIGGAPKIVTVATAEAGTATAYGNLATTGPDFTTPVAGDWQIVIQARITAESGSNIAFMSYDVGGTAALDIDSAQGNIATPERPSLHAISQKAGVAASTLLRARYKNAGGTSITYADRRLIVLPIAVS
jgi:hypothetical protein